MLFNILLGLALSGNIAWSDSFLAVLEFAKVFFGGILCGLFIGFIIIKLMEFLDLSASGLIVLSLIMAYLSFIIAEHYLHVSGVMSVLSAALCLGYYGISRLSIADVKVLRETWEFLALAFNSLLFLLVGLTEDGKQLLTHLDVIIIAAIIVLIARALVVYPLVPATTRLFSLPAVNMGARHIMWWGGLKGGLAIAIALSIPFDLPERELILHLTLGVVLCSLLINASTIRPLMHFLGLSKLDADEMIEFNRGVTSTTAQINKLLVFFSDSNVLNTSVHQAIQSHYQSTLKQSANFDNNVPNNVRQQFIDALLTEFKELEELNDIGLLPAYAY